MNISRKNGKKIPHLASYLKDIGPEEHKFRNKIIKHNISIK